MPISKCRDCGEETKVLKYSEIRPGYFDSTVAPVYRCRNNHCPHWDKHRLPDGEMPLYDDDEKAEADSGAEDTLAQTEKGQKSAKTTRTSKSSTAKKTARKKDVAKNG